MEFTSYMQVKGLTFRHCNTSATAIYGGAFEMGAHSRLETRDVQWCDFAGIALRNQKADDEIIDLRGPQLRGRHQQRRRFDELLIRDGTITTTITATSISCYIRVA